MALIEGIAETDENQVPTTDVHPAPDYDEVRGLAFQTDLNWPI